ncbi:hypothetical protein AGLY_005258 [Aphis glycines]|uniref:Dehydrogenase/reductase SDR family member 11 n=1 Tax=Aphis glycines TaxID=307491 RepID=A0A6G0TXI6_APHGL|nr:hypothetical protein AGLY_005258 [Aphis glycines]
MERWSGKVAIVTGASAGIGAAIAVELAKNGVHVVALARRENALKELAETVNYKDYGTIYTKVCDVTNEQAVKDVFSWVDSTLGGASILINNAGVAKLSSLLSEYSYIIWNTIKNVHKSLNIEHRSCDTDGKLEDWQDTINLNVLALSVCSREAYKSMTKNKIDGHIIQINSIAGHCLTPYFGFKMYNASKHAVTVLCDGLRHELQLMGSKIKVSSVSPGPVATEILAEVSKVMKDASTKDFNILNTNDIANAVITSLATPPNVLIAEMTIIPTGSLIQTHLQPSSQVVENVIYNNSAEIMGRQFPRRCRFKQKKKDHISAYITINTMERWSGKVAIVTGASAGIGAAIVVQLAKNGVHVVALARREKELKELAESLNDKDYETIYTKVCDVTNEQAVKDVFSWVDSTLGGANGKLEDWQEILNLNVLALSVCSREAYKSMTKNKIDGHIIQINSISGHSLTPNFAHKMYNASKYAVTVLCDGLRHELQLTGSKIKVSSVSPGPTATDMLASILKYSKEVTTAADFKILDAEDVANAVITSLATPPNVLIADMTIIPTGFTIQMHFQPSSQVVENLLNA